MLSIAKATSTIKIKGLKKAIGTYNRINAGGCCSPWYGYLMFNKSTGELWTDEFYSIGHNMWNEYHSADIINLGKEMTFRGIEIAMQNVKEFIKEFYN